MKIRPNNRIAIGLEYTTDFGHSIVNLKIINILKNNMVMIRVFNEVGGRKWEITESPNTITKINLLNTLKRHNYILV